MFLTDLKCQLPLLAGNIVYRAERTPVCIEDAKPKHD